MIPISSLTDIAAIGGAKARQSGVGDDRIPPGDREVRMASKDLRYQIERWENEGGAGGGRHGSGRSGRDLEATEHHSGA